MVNVEPVCGPFPAAEGPAFGRTLNWVWAAIGIIGGIVSGITGGMAFLEGFRNLTQLAEWITGWSVGWNAAAAGGALLGFAIGLGIVLSKGLDRIQGRPGANRCYSGIVNSIARAFGGATD